MYMHNLHVHVHCTLENPKKPFDLRTISSFMTCSSLLTTRSRCEAAQNPMPIAQPCNTHTVNYTHVHCIIHCTYTLYIIHVHVSIMGDEKEGRKKEASKVKQTRQNNTAHPRQLIFPEKNELPRVGLEPTTL